MNLVKIINLRLCLDVPMRGYVGGLTWTKEEMVLGLLKILKIYILSVV